MKILILLAIMGSAFASYSDMQARGQDPKMGSFYLPSDRNVFRNPALLDQGMNRLYLESEKEAGLKMEDFIIAVDEKKWSAGFKFLNDFGFMAQISPVNGEGIKYFSATGGWVHNEGVELYGNISSQKISGDDDATSYKIGSVLPMGDYSLFVEYKGDVDGPKYNNLLLGASYRHVFVAAPVDFDLTYTNTDDFSGEAKNMVITASSRHKLTTDFDLLASVNRGVFFSSFTKVNAGLCYHGTKGLQIEAATSVDPVSKSNPEYGDFNFSLSLSMFI